MVEEPLSEPNMNSGNSTDPTTTTLTKKFFSSDLFRNIIMGASFTLATTAFISQCFQQQELRDHQYLLGTLSNRPVMFISSDSLCATVVATDIMTPEGRLSTIAAPSNYKDRLDSLPFIETATCELTLTNRGESHARITLVAYSDTMSWDQIIWNDVLGDDWQDSTMSYSTLDKVMDVLPNDSIRIPVKHEIQFIKDSHFILHLLLLYENDAGAVFYTYGWCQFVINTHMIAYGMDDKGKVSLSTINFIDEGEKDNSLALSERITQSTGILDIDRAKKYQGWRLEVARHEEISTKGN